MAKRREVNPRGGGGDSGGVPARPGLA
jgi:hypothetical protein